MSIDYKKYPQWWVKSSNSKREYKVTYDTDKELWMCSCPGWINNRKCKHTGSADAYRYSSGRVNESGVRPVSGSDIERKEADIKESLGTEKFVKRKISNVLRGMKN